MAESKMTKSVDLNRLVSRGDSQYSIYDRLNKAMCLMLILLLIAPTAYTQDPEQREGLSADRTKRVVELRGRKSKQFAERLREQDSDVQEAAQWLSLKGYRAGEVAIAAYSEDFIRGANFGKNVEVSLSQWEDNDPNVGTLLIVARRRNGKAAHISAIQIDREGNLLWHRDIVRTEAGGRRAVLITPKTKAKVVLAQLGIPYMEYSEMNFYGCASSACGLPAITMLAFGWPGATVWAGECTLFTLGCAVAFLHIGWWYPPHPPKPSGGIPDDEIGGDIYDEPGASRNIPPCPDPYMYSPGC